jgi:hypothetical protein
MINDLDDTLATLLREKLPPVLMEQSLKDPEQISFAIPDNQFSKSVKLPAIDLFLYDIRENLELRSNEVFVDRQSDKRGIVTKAPARIDFSYLVTAWPSESVRDPSKEEHQMLGAVMRVLLCHRTIPKDYLQGSLKGQEPDLPLTSLQPGRLQSLGEFWQALGGKPKVALNLQVTLSVATSEPQPVDLVTKQMVRLHLLDGEPA